MNKYIKVLSVVLALTSSVYLPSAFAASTNSSTEMLITLAETDPVLVDRLNDIALNDPKLLKKILKLAGSDATQLERLINLAESDPQTFEKLVNIKDVEATEELTVEQPMYSTFGTIKDGDIMQ
ncbi:hypothetical protein [Colwellia psychrerythraea]|uniref:Uncharacterized protein n=1 Tax=Colwellia psychrerythraea TaxID=28229 RepID=A0A099K8K7_COLPS|nr:hypothetical protein [Colwellia psychrerythraea]KGJ87069.1 hypothetical protein ND2E_0476 [Colwellia psychrerythraea]